ncbi:MAG: hypothetical protein KDD56_10595, partial [Bdellovibrionales bacterium]|nr:hypothetical protein [Bdellovibrionales bacterium]
MKFYLELIVLSPVIEDQTMLGIGKSKKVVPQELKSLKSPDKLGLKRATAVTALILLSSALGGKKETFADDRPDGPVAAFPGIVLSQTKYEALLHVVRSHPDAGHFLREFNKLYKNYKKDDKHWRDIKGPNETDPKPIFLRKVRTAANEILDLRLRRIGHDTSSLKISDFGSFLTLSKDTRLQAIGVISQLPMSKDRVEISSKAKEESLKKYPKDNEALDKATKNFVGLLEH